MYRLFCGHLSRFFSEVFSFCCSFTYTLIGIYLVDYLTDGIFTVSGRTYSPYRYYLRYRFQAIAAVDLASTFGGLRDLIGREEITTMTPSEQQGHRCFATGFSGAPLISSDVLFCLGARSSCIRFKVVRLAGLSRP